MIALTTSHDATLSQYFDLYRGIGKRTGKSKFERRPIDLIV
jgi:hypothetical protein